MKTPFRTQAADQAATQDKIPIGSPSLVAAIAAKLATAQAALGELQVRRADVALQAHQSGDTSALAQLDAEIAVLATTVADLGDAHKGAVKAQAAAMQAAKVAQHKSEVRNVKLHLGKRDAAGKAFSEAIALAITAWRVMVQEGRKASAAAPALGFPAPNAMKTYTAIGTLNTLVSREMARLGGWDNQIGAESRAFPGANPHDIMMTGQPEKLPPLVDVLEGASKAVIDAITGKAGAE